MYIVVSAAYQITEVLINAFLNAIVGAVNAIANATVKKDEEEHTDLEN
jgi:hypothetical protein